MKNEMVREGVLARLIHPEEEEEEEESECEKRASRVERYLCAMAFLGEGIGAF